MQMFRRENHERTMQTRFYREGGRSTLHKVRRIHDHGGIPGLFGPDANAKEKGGPQKEKDGGGNRR